MQLKNRTGYIFLRTNGSSTKKVWEHLKTLDFVIGAWVVTGDYDVITWVNAKNEDDLYRYATTLRHIAGVELTNSHLAHAGDVRDWKSFEGQHGAWVRVRADKIETTAASLKEMSYVGGWAEIPGDYDYLVWTQGKDLRETTENVMRMTEHAGWRTYTHVPVWAYLNKDMQKTLQA